MAESPIWEITIPDELDSDLVEEALGKTASWQMDGTGLQIERLDIGNGSTRVFVSGSEADARRLLDRIGERSPKVAGRVQCAVCSAEGLHRIEPRT